MIGALRLGLRKLAATHLLRLEIFVEKVKCLFIRAGTTGDGEHALASLIMRCLGDRNAGARCLADLADLAATAADDAANHVCGNADVLGLDIFTFLNSRGWSAIRCTITARLIGCGGNSASEVSSIASPVVASLLGSATKAGGSASTIDWRRCARLNANDWAIEDCAVSALFIINEAFTNLPSGLLNAFGRALDLDNAFSGLRKHLLLSNHAHSRGILDLLDLESLATDDGTHLIMRNQQANRWG